jgi:UDP-N-acetylmuramate: L-alanyl-gamma-D-glutamyl-meso-diaminopimelate ligase
VVTNVEFDHADIYRDETAYRFAFERFVNLVPRTGSLVIGWDGEIEQDLAERSLAPVESFAAGDTHAERGHPRWIARDVRYGPAGTEFTVVHRGLVMGRFERPLAGGCNVRTCRAAVAAARAVGASWDGVRKGLATFKTVRRRMEVRGEIAGVTVIDDFAHHPTAVRETLAAVRLSVTDSVSRYERAFNKNIA